MLDREVPGSRMERKGVLRLDKMTCSGPAAYCDGHLDHTEMAIAVGSGAAIGRVVRR